MEYSIKITEKLHKELTAFCDLNSIKIEDFCEQAIKKELVTQKYGNIPFGVIENEQIPETPKKDVLPEANIIQEKPVKTEITPVVEIPKQVEIKTTAKPGKIEKQQVSIEKKQNNTKKRRL